jgi:hypothetical protein
MERNGTSGNCGIGRIEVEVIGGRILGSWWCWCSGHLRENKKIKKKKEKKKKKTLVSEALIPYN